MSTPQTIRQHLMCVQAIADRIDQDWIPSRSSEALVLELRAISSKALALLDEAERMTAHGNDRGHPDYVAILDPEEQR